MEKLDVDLESIAGKIADYMGITEMEFLETVSMIVNNSYVREGEDEKQIRDTR